VRLLAQVTSALRQERIDFALIGAAALAAHGVSRSTADIDLLVTDPRVLSLDWCALNPTWNEADVDVRRGDADDPLAGVIRFTQPGAREVDLVVGRYQWQRDIIGRAHPIDLGDIQIPVVDLAGVILLKLYAGGVQDLWDVEQLLASTDRGQATASVDALIHELPAEAQELWRRLRSAP
jgi:predicted nucleotidyltransferase